MSVAGGNLVTPFETTLMAPYHRWLAKRRLSSPRDRCRGVTFQQGARSWPQMLPGDRRPFPGRALASVPPQERRELGSTGSCIKDKAVKGKCSRAPQRLQQQPSLGE
ncbi:hypothetical protein EYF80_028349 [Liparis tanakae]|uniref:Uncharacterized protein n=1 Tax=Liparis tanakae TaxID=230148 RepID=A0A4Z2H7J7_9TELE|nr:hypothetical protein EYF80_028349 [Liparis tanakae]